MSMEKVIQLALSQVGYLEKKSNYDLDSLTGNAGSNNYTKYGAWYGMNGQPWCDIFVSWCAYYGGEADAIGKYAYVPYHQNFFEKNGQYFARGAKTPQRGDVIIFKDESHIGFVYDVDSKYVYTVEGNTSGGNTLVANGGSVATKYYPLNSSYIQGYGRPAYSSTGVTGQTEQKSETTTSAKKVEKYFYPWVTYKNGSTDEIVYKDTSRKTRTGSLNPYEKCYCIGIYGDSYLVCYKLDGTEDDWAVGYVKYDGGVS